MSAHTIAKMTSIDDAEKRRVRLLKSRLSKTQAITGLIIATHVIPHLLNHASFLVGKFPLHSRIFAQIHWWSTKPLVEFTLLSALTIHALASAWKAMLDEFTLDFDNNVHRASGWILAVFIAGHVYSTRWEASKIGLAKTDLSVATIAARLLPVFVPYYVVFSAAGAIHALSGTLRAIKILKVNRNARAYGMWFRIAAAAVATVAGAAALDMTGTLGARYPMPEEAKLVDHYLNHGYWPRFLTRRIYFEKKGDWFAKFKWRG